MPNHIWFIRNETDKSDYYAELEQTDDVKFIYKTNAFRNTLLSKLFRFAFSTKVNGIVHVPGKFLLLRLLWIEQDIKATDVLIFNQGWYDKGMIAWLNQKHSDSPRVLYCDDTLSCYAQAIPDMHPSNLDNEFDIVLCYNPDDANKYGYEQGSAWLSKKQMIDCYKYNDADVAFIGQGKDRLNVLTRISRHLKGKCKLDFLIIGKEQKEENGILYSTRRMPYEEYLSRECAANCILEILKGDTSGSTLRCWEAVYYNKKLLTNWKGIFGFPFYDPRYMRYFEEPEDIDISFVTKKENVDYHYNNQNSPVRMIEKIDALLLERGNPK